jgi:transposase
MEAAMAKKYRVTLTAQEQADLQFMISRGKGAARKLAHARILLQADESKEGPASTDEQIAQALNTTTRTVERVRQRFVEQGLESALLPARSRRIYSRKLDGKQEAKLIALACSRPPAGKSRWTLRLLAEEVVEMEIVDSLSHETVRQTLKKTSSSRT